MGAGPPITCPKCGDEITSTHRHDFVSCKCGAVAIDGGDSYLRLSGNRDILDQVIADIQSRDIDPDNLPKGSKL